MRLRLLFWLLAGWVRHDCWLSKERSLCTNLSEDSIPNRNVFDPSQLSQAKILVYAITACQCEVFLLAACLEQIFIAIAHSSKNLIQ